MLFGNIKKKKRKKENFCGFAFDLTNFYYPKLIF